MTQQEKQLLLKDLCARLPYGVEIRITSDECDDGFRAGEFDNILRYHHLEAFVCDRIEVRPYLRPMSSMTEEEKAELLNLRKEMNMHQHLWFDRVLDFYLSHHLDWRGLILLGLALEAPDNMYKIE